MRLSDEIKEQITAEYTTFKEKLYAGKSLEDRRELDQFFTPPESTIDMIESFSIDSLSDQQILDPCCGSGNLLAACLIAGADVDKLYGNEYDAKMVAICRERLKAIAKEKGLKFPEHHIHQGNALQNACLNNFSAEYQREYDAAFIDDLSYAQTSIDASVKQQQLNMIKEELW